MNGIHYDSSTYTTSMRVKMFVRYIRTKKKQLLYKASIRTTCFLRSILHDFTSHKEIHACTILYRKAHGSENYIYIRLTEIDVFSVVWVLLLMCNKKF